MDRKIVSLECIGQETLRILELGKLTTRSGQEFDFFKEQKAAEEGAKLYTPAQLSTLLQQHPPKADGVDSTIIGVTDETTQAFHKALGFEETERVAYFRKLLR